MTTGALGSASEAFARQYAKILTRAGVELKFMPSTKLIEVELDTHGGHVSKELSARLERLDERANHLHIPVGFADVLYALRIHNLVRDRLQQLPAAADAPRLPRSDFTADVTSAPS